MKHPDREEWIPFLFGEAKAESRARLKQHLDQCADCARQVSAWRRSLRSLDRWSLAKPRAQALSTAAPMWKWALAALLVVGAGFVLGRLTGPSSAQLLALRAEMQSSIRASLQSEMDQALHRIEEQSSTALANTEARLTQASAVERQRLWRSVVDVLSSARSEDARTLQVLLEHSQEENDAQFVALRKDLETLASMTDEEIRQARLRLVQLAAVKSSTD